MTAPQVRGDIVTIANMRALLVFERGRDDVPEEWAVFTAPRPLSGHMTWEGDFIGGVFRAAVDLRADDADAYLRDAIDNHAAALLYVPPCHVRRMLISEMTDRLRNEPETLGSVIKQIASADDADARCWLMQAREWTYADAVTALERAQSPTDHPS